MAEPQGWEVERMEPIEWVYPKDPSVTLPIGTIVNFKNGRRLETNIVEFKPIDVLYSKNNIPFLLFSGRDCSQCDMNTSIYAYSPVNGDFNRPRSETRYVYPGKVNFYMDGTPLSDSRMFYGNCLSEGNSIIIWYMRNINDSEVWERSVYVMEFENTEAKGRFLEKPLPQVNETVKLVELGICKELPGIERNSEP
ncbi:MAG: hypothetical protein ACE5IJ_11810 [Thermoplasmata archaeon]